MGEFTTKEIELLIKIFYIRFPRNINYSLLANELDLRQSDKRFVKIKNWLLDKNVVKEVGSIGSSKIIEINLKKLKEEIPEIPFIKEFHEKFIEGVWNKGIWAYR